MAPLQLARLSKDRIDFRHALAGNIDGAISE